MPPPLVFTIGYEAHRQPESLVAALASAGIERVIDVRELPLSRRRGFSKTRLSEVLRSAKIDYLHERRLGNPKPYRSLYKNGQRRRGEQAYRRHLANTGKEAIRCLADSLSEARTCLLCVEDDHEHCHRAVIVDALGRELPGLRVTNL